MLLTKDNSERAKQRFDANMTEATHGKAFGKALNHIGSAVMCIIGVLIMAFIIGDSASLAESYMKFPSMSSFTQYCEVPYDELHVYNVETHWDEDEEDYVKYETPAYAFANDKGDYYDAGRISPDSKSGKLLAQKIKEHNIKVENIKSIEVLDNENSGD